jgi:hypothetical protein
MSKHAEFDPLRMDSAKSAWNPLKAAPQDGTEIELLVHHHNWKHAKGEDKKKWEQIVRAKWIDFNGGGWTWNGMAGVPIYWRPIVAPSDSGREG